MRLIGTAVVALAGAWLFERLKIPAGAMIGATVAVAALNLSGRVGVVDLPEPAQFLTFTALGWMIGVSFTPQTVAVLRTAAVPVLLIVGMLIGAGALLAWGLSAWAGIDSATAFLAAAPGGLSQMVAVSAAIGADSPLVATVHTVRLVAVLLVSPLAIRLLSPPA
ncbi:MAG: AbrB family transcriptional regulator [Egibacteraceae bacterium]